MDREQFGRLESQVDELIALCSALRQENLSLRRETQSWQDEKRRLVQRHAQVRQKMELLIRRLKTLEQNA